MLLATCFGHPQPSLGIKVCNVRPKCTLRPKYGRGRLKHVEYRVRFNKFVVFDGNTLITVNLSQQNVPNSIQNYKN